MDPSHLEAPDISFRGLRYANLMRQPIAILYWEKTTGKPFRRWEIADWMLAITGELGELANYLKKQSRGQEISKKAIADEFADVLIYLDLAAAHLGIDLAEAVRSKFNEVSDKYHLEVKL